MKLEKMTDHEFYATVHDLAKTEDTKRLFEEDKDGSITSRLKDYKDIANNPYFQVRKSWWRRFIWGRYERNERQTEN